MKTIKLKLTVQDQTNPILVDNEDNIVVPTSRMAWIVQKDGKIVSAAPAILAHYIGTIVDVQIDSAGKPVLLNDKAIIVL
jgi:hypothetical protein